MSEIERDRNKRSKKSFAIREFRSAKPRAANQKITCPRSLPSSGEQLRVASAGNRGLRVLRAYRAAAGWSTPLRSLGDGHCAVLFGDRCPTAPGMRSFAATAGPAVGNGLLQVNFEDDDNFADRPAESG